MLRMFQSAPAEATESNQFTPMLLVYRQALGLGGKVVVETQLPCQEQIDALANCIRQEFPTGAASYGNREQKVSVHSDGEYYDSGLPD